MTVARQFKGQGPSPKAVWMTLKLRVTHPGSKHPKTMLSGVIEATDIVCKSHICLKKSLSKTLILGSGLTFQSFDRDPLQKATLRVLEEGGSLCLEAFHTLHTSIYLIVKYEVSPAWASSLVISRSLSKASTTNYREHFSSVKIKLDDLCKVGGIL